ncbi:14568_t:CDS:1, partial [Acaulospora colombiana]
EDRLDILIGSSNQSSARALMLLRQNNAKEATWLDGLAKLARLNERHYQESLHLLVQLDYNFVATLRFVDRVKDPMGCGGFHFSMTLSLLSNLRGEASVKEEIVEIMNKLGLYDCNEQRLTFIFSSISYDSVRMRSLVRKLLAINGRLNNSQRDALWLLEFYNGFEDFMHLMESLVTRWVEDEDRCIVLEFLETLDGDHRRLEQVIGTLHQYEKGSSLERLSLPNRALKALKRNDYDVDKTLQEWRRLHAVNPRTTHWDYVLKVYAECLYDIEYTVSLLHTLNTQYIGDPFWYDVLVVHTLHICQKTGIKPNANRMKSHFKKHYRYNGKSLWGATIGMKLTHLASVIRDDKKGLYGRIHIAGSR